MKRSVTVSGKCGDTLYVFELRNFFPVALSSVQSIQRDLFHFVGLDIAVGEEGFAAFLSFPSQSRHVILPPKPVQNVVSRSACDPFAKSLLRL